MQPQIQPSQVPIATAINTIAPIAIAVVVTPQPTQTYAPTEIVVKPQPTPQPRWMEYERALSQAFFPWPPSPYRGICEWQILGMTKTQAYVWAICQDTSTYHSMMSAPAVIFIGASGSIENIQIPGDGTKYGPDIRKLFPPYLQKKIFAQDVELKTMEAHLEVRKHTDEPPLIVMAGTVLP